MDGVIGQTDVLFLQNLIEYNKIISQRNALLKFFALNNTFDKDSLVIYNEQLVKRSAIIYEKRLAFMEDFIPVFNARYKNISEGKEIISLEYESQLQKKNSQRTIRN